jgi:hypothetical protein
VSFDPAKELGFYMETIQDRAILAQEMLCHQKMLDQMLQLHAVVAMGRSARVGDGPGSLPSGSADDRCSSILEAAGGRP